MATNDARITAWDLRASAGTTVSLEFTSSEALASLSVYTGGSVSDVDDLTGATEHVAALSGDNLVATVDVIVPDSSVKSTPLRLVVDGVVQTVGVLIPTSRGAESPGNSITLTPGSYSFDLAILGVGGAGTNGTYGADDFWIFPSRFADANGAPTLSSAGAGSSREAWLFDAALLEAVVGSFNWHELPDWDAFDVFVQWSNNGTGVGDVVWHLDHSTGQVVGGLVSSGFTVGANITDTAGAQNEIMETEVGTAITVDRTGPIVLKIFRVANNAADTLANDAAFLGLRLGKA